MRVLVTSCPGYGFLFPLIPLSWALRNAGHDVLVAQSGNFAEVAAAAGLPSVTVARDVAIRDVFQDADHSAYHRDPLAALLRHVTEHYTRLVDRTAEPMVELARRWQPDLVLHTPWEFAGPLAGALLGVPTVCQTWGVALPAELQPAVARALAPVYERWGVSRGAPPAHLLVDVCPPRLQYPDAPSATQLSYVPYNGAGVLPDWLLAPRGGPRICVTLGTIPVPGEHRTVMSTVLTALEGIAAEVVVLTGGALEAARAPTGAAFRTVSWVPLRLLLDSCDLVIHHGGSGTTMTSLSAGLPQLMLPQMCDHFRHAERTAAVGAGVSLSGTAVDPVNIRSAVDWLLNDPAPRLAARAIRKEMRAMPPPSEVVARLEALAASGAGSRPFAVTDRERHV